MTVNNPFAAGAAPQGQAPAQQQTFGQQPQQAPAANPFGGQALAQQQPQQFAAPAQQQAPEVPQDTGFEQPNSGSGDQLDKEAWQSFHGLLVLFEPSELRTGVKTKNGISDAVVADVSVIDHPNGPQFFRNVLVFPPALVTATKKSALAAQQTGQPGRVLGRIQRYTTKEDRTTVELVPHTQSDATLAGQYIAWRASQTVAQPQTQQQPPF